jgi:hypothetical protein
MKKLITPFFLIAFSIFFVACSDDNTPISHSTDINELIRQAGELKTVPQPSTAQKHRINSFTETETFDGKEYISNTEVWKMENRFDKSYAFNSTYADALYPGAIIQGKGLLEGSLTLLGSFERSPMMISLEGTNASVEVENPNKSAMNNALSQLLQKETPTAASIDYYKSETHSVEQSFMEIGVDAKWLPIGIQGSFSKESNITHNSVLLFFKQVYYTVTAQGFTQAADYFDKSVSSYDIESNISIGNPPCYISSVDYGRIIIVKMTAEASHSQIISDIQASYVTINGKAEFDDSQMNYNYSFSASIVGGSAEGVTQAVTIGSIAEINNLINEEAQYSASNPGFPISYTARYLYNGQPVRLGGSTQYNVTDWQINEDEYQTFDFQFNNFYIASDGHSWTDPDMYYQIQIKDKNGSVFTQANGSPAELSLAPDNSIEVDDEDELPIVNGGIYGISIPKTDNESFTIEVTLIDKDDDVVAAGWTIKDTFPWNEGSFIYGEDRYEYMHRTTGDEYAIYLNFKVSKR